MNNIEEMDTVDKEKQIEEVYTQTNIKTEVS